MDFNLFRRAVDYLLFERARKFYAVYYRKKKKPTIADSVATKHASNVHDVSEGNHGFSHSKYYIYNSGYFFFLSLIFSHFLLIFIGNSSSSMCRWCWMMLALRWAKRARSHTLSRHCFNGFFFGCLLIERITEKWRA